MTTARSTPATSNATGTANSNENSAANGVATAAAIAWKPPRPATAREADKLALELFVGGYEGEQLPDSMVQRLHDGLSGVILFARNVRKQQEQIDVDALVAQTASVQAAAARHPANGALPAIVSVDQEGGLVARLRAPFTRFPPMREVAEVDEIALTEAVGAQTGRECLAAGFNVDFAPVLDIDTNPANPIIGNRAFGRTPEQVIAHAGAFARGLRSAGVLGCGKHFPGHGDTAQDSHLELPVLPFDLERLAAIEMRPFAALASELQMVMTAHILFPALDAARPATLSPAILEPLLRARCGFEGVIVSDDLEMKGVAAAFSMADCVRLGLEAGVNLFLVCRYEDLLEEARCEAARLLRDHDELGRRATLAIGRVRALRSQLRLPPADPQAARRVLADAEAVRLRNRFGLGTVTTR